MPSKYIRSTFRNTFRSVRSTIRSGFSKGRVNGPKFISLNFADESV